MFRENSLAIFLLSFLFRHQGMNFFSHISKPVFDKICSLKMTLEVNPHKLDNNEQIEKNARTIWDISAEFLKGTVTHIDKCPL